MNAPELIRDDTGAPAWPGAPPFRLIAIAGTPERIDDIAAFASAWGKIGFGLMLRDPNHQRAAVEMLAAHALSINLPPNITLITNSFAVPKIGPVHFPSPLLSETASSSGINLSEEYDAIQWGYSAHSQNLALMAAMYGAWYITLSPIFPTPSKPGHPGIGLDMLQCICMEAPVPVFALGGINPENVLHALRAGAYGIASISMFAPENRESLERLLKELSETEGR